MRGRVIGVYGGTFDPVHYGHLRTALEVAEILGLSELRFVPCRIPPHRQTPGATPQQRLAMLEAALADAPACFRIDQRELERPGPSYMVDTLATLRGEVGQASLVLILGLDAFLGFYHWHRWREILDLAHLAIMRRPGFLPEPEAVLAMEYAARRVPDAGQLRGRPAGCMYDLAVTPLAISASQIRELCQSGRSPRYLTPDAVVRQIGTQGLYAGVAGQG